ncbi:hypothetical protein [Clostridium sp. UBA5119]|uniref:hypothetical protein n=1 Tax=Clostridium sp. UBA5119 TaxID=1946366 RepID=UPI003217FDC3
MEENNQNAAIKIAIGVIMTLILVGAMITLFLKVVPSIDKANSKIDTISSQMDMIYFKSYDDTEVSGSEVISAINTKASSDITVKVTTQAGTEATYNSSTYNITNVNDKNYIEPTAKFDSTVERNSNNAVSGITFVQLASK